MAYYPTWAELFQQARHMAQERSMSVRGSNSTPADGTPFIISADSGTPVQNVSSAFHNATVHPFPQGHVGQGRCIHSVANSERQQKEEGLQAEVSRLTAANSEGQQKEEWLQVKVSRLTAANSKGQEKEEWLRAEFSRLSSGMQQKEKWLRAEVSRLTDANLQKVARISELQQTLATNEKRFLAKISELQLTSATSEKRFLANLSKLRQILATNEKRFLALREQATGAQQQVEQLKTETTELNRKIKWYAQSLITLQKRGVEPEAVQERSQGRDVEPEAVQERSQGRDVEPEAVQERRGVEPEVVQERRDVEPEAVQERRGVEPEVVQERMDVEPKAVQERLPQLVNGSSEDETLLPRRGGTNLDMLAEAALRDAAKQSGDICKATAKRSGPPCSRLSLENSGYCGRHQRFARVEEIKRRGGRVCARWGKNSLCELELSPKWKRRTCNNCSKRRKR
jgi:hypothetical protein